MYPRGAYPVSFYPGMAYPPGSIGYARGLEFTLPERRGVALPARRLHFAAAVLELDYERTGRLVYERPAGRVHGAVGLPTLDFTLPARRFGYERVGALHFVAPPDGDEAGLDYTLPARAAHFTRPAGAAGYTLASRRLHYGIRP